ncbi:MAG: transcriptional regulator [Proteobacteria bacterium]|nr:transcriptional regulator [Pseudomonadota bacterium]
MSVRLNLLLSNELNRQIEKLVVDRETTKADVLRKAIALYVAATEGKEKGLKIGLARPEQTLETEFVGL